MSEEQTEAFEAYGGLLRRYHDSLDLVSSRAAEQLPRLIDEARQYGSLIAGLSPTPTRLLDVGSGGGLPGIPIAIANPGLEVHLVERRRRRIAFLRIAVSNLALSNVEVHEGDVKGVRLPPVDVVTAQAVGEPREIYRLSCHLHGPEVWLVSRRGPDSEEELARLEIALDTAILQSRRERLTGHGTLLAARLPGGLACPPSG